MSIGATVALEIVGGKVGELAGEHTLQTRKLQHAKANWDDGITS